MKPRLLAAGLALLLAGCQGYFPPGPDYYDPDGYRPAAPRKGEYPVATPARRPGWIYSPYEPHNLLDVEGYRTGELARDPYNGHIFIVP